MTVSIKEAISGILARFQSGDIPDTIAHSMYPISNIPSAKWSLLNRIMMVIANTQDARGIRQWNSVGRKVKKGAKAFYILIPRFVKQENDDGEEETLLSGFMTKPVFRIEDTEGDPLNYEKMELPDLPLIERAREWGISVKAIPGNYRYLGFFSQKENEIALATPEESVFFHELSHAAHARLLGQLKDGQDWKQEIVAELSAAVLCKIIGKTSKHLGNNYRYIEHYAQKADLSPVQGCLRIMSDIEKVLKYILGDKKTKLLRNTPTKINLKIIATTHQLTSPSK